MEPGDTIATARAKRFAIAPAASRADPRRERAVAVAALDQAREIWSKVNELETEWEMVLESSLQWAVTIEEMESQLKEQDNAKQRDVLKQLRLLQKQDAVSRTQELELLKARKAREKAMESLVDKFWEED